MQPIYKKSVIVMSIIAASAALSACGGGSSSSSTTATAPTGKAIDFYLKNATVIFTDCPGQTTTTDANGNFAFPAFCPTSAVIVTGGIDSGTNQPFKGVLKNSAQPASATPAIVSVLTTLISSGVDSNKLAALLGLSGQNLLTLDPMTNVQALKANVVLQQLLDQVSAALAGTAVANGQSLTVEEAEAKALAALVAQISSTNNATLDSITSSASINSIIISAATSANFTNPASAAVNSAAISSSLTQVGNTFNNATLVNGQVSTGSVNIAGLTSIAIATNTALDNGAAPLNNYVQVNSVALNNNAATPITNASTLSLTATGGGLTDIQVGLAAVGSPFGTGASTVNTALSYTINGNRANIIINNIQLAFNGSGALTNVTVPSGSLYSYSLTGASNVSGTLSSGVVDTLFTNGKLDLSVTSFLAKLKAVSGQDVSAYTPKANDTVNVAIAMAPVKVGAGSVQAAPITIKSDTNTLTGQGINATVAVK
jgi:hypothetical protein